MTLNKFGPFPGHTPHNCPQCNQEMPWPYTRCKDCDDAAWNEMIAKCEADRLEREAARARAMELERIRQHAAQREPVSAYWAAKHEAPNAFPIPAFGMDSDCFYCCAILDEHLRVGSYWSEGRPKAFCPRHQRSTDDMRIESPREGGVA